MEAGVHGQHGLSAGIPVWWSCAQENAATLYLRVEAWTALVQRSNSIPVDQRRNVNVRIIHIKKVRIK